MRIGKIAGPSPARCTCIRAGPDTSARAFLGGRHPLSAHEERAYDARKALATVSKVVDVQESRSR